MYDANFFKRLFFFQPKLPKGLENNYIIFLKNYFQNLSVKGMEEMATMVKYIYFQKGGLFMSITTSGITSVTSGSNKRK